MERESTSDGDGVLPVAIGTIVWAIALVTLLILRGRLEESGSTWWIGVAAIGLISGLGGLLFLTWRRRRHS